jgi:HK97 family phage portal protein
VSFHISAGQVRSAQRSTGITPWAWGNNRALPPRASARSLPGATIQMTQQVSYTYEQIYQTQPALRTVVDFLARNVAQLGLDVYQKNGEDRTKLLDHPLSVLMEHPMPVVGSKWTKYKLVSWTMHELCIFGDAFWLKMKFKGGQFGVLPVPRRFMDIIGEDFVNPPDYRFSGNSGARVFPAEDVVHFHLYDPDDPRTGYSPIETLRQILADDYAASSFREQLWTNGARVAGYIARPLDAPAWSDKAKDRFTQDWRNQYSGDGPQVGGTPVLEEGMQFVNAGVTPKDAQYVESRTRTLDEVAMLYHVHPMMLGSPTAGGTQSSVPAVHKILYQDSLGPWLTQLSQDIETQLLIDLDPGALDGSTYVEFNLAEKLRGDFEEQAAALSALVGAPVMSRSEARARLNLPLLPGTEDLIVPMNVTQGGLASPKDTAPNNPSNAESNGQLPLKARTIHGELPINLAAPTIEEMLV